MTTHKARAKAMTRPVTLLGTAPPTLLGPRTASVCSLAGGGLPSWPALLVMKLRLGAFEDVAGAGTTMRVSGLSSLASTSTTTAAMLSPPPRSIGQCDELFKLLRWGRRSGPGRRRSVRPQLPGGARRTQKETVPVPGGYVDEVHFDRRLNAEGGLAHGAEGARLPEPGLSGRRRPAPAPGCGRR